jgi:methyl-accepting chemotaxis protein
MSFLTRLSIHRRTALVMGLLMAAIVAMAVVAVLKFKALGATVQELSQAQAERIQLSQRWDANIREAVARWGAVALAPDASLYTEVKDATLAISTDTTQVQKRFAEIELSEAGKKLGAELGDIRKQWLAERDKVRAAIESGDQEGAKALGRGSFATVSKTYLEVSGRHAAYQMERARLEGEEAAAAARASLLLMMAVAAACLLGGVLLAAAFVRSLVRPIEAALGVAERIAAGDLSQGVPLQPGAAGRDELARLLSAMQGMQSELRQLIGRIGSSAEGMALASSEIANGNADLSQRTERTAGSLQETASAMEKLTGSVGDTARSAGSAKGLADEAGQAARVGGEVVSAVVTTMGEISESSRRIGEIVGTIDSLAFQTNILALNAAVEAARAGEQGRGFAVVASEVRALAQRSAAASREIRGLIEGSTAKVGEGARLVEQAGQAMGQLVTRVNGVAAVIREISDATEAQSQGLAQINGAVAELDRMTQQNAALVEQSAAAAATMGQQARELSAQTQRFRVGALA